MEGNTDKEEDFTTVESSETESTPCKESEASVESLTKELRATKAKYETQIAVLEQRLQNYEIERLDLIKKKDEAYSLYSDALKVSP
jgi:hypothetical protein